MPSLQTDGTLYFFAVDTGTALIPTSVFGAFNSPADIVDDNGDGNMDTATDYYDNFGTPYSGYTISINGKDYAIFYGGGVYYVPFITAVEDLSALINTQVTQIISNTGENAVVANYCFAAGILIATPSGQTAVEDLSIGDRIVTAEGREVAVKWVGRQTVMPLFGPAERLMPVRFAAGSLGGGLPHAELTVTADHGMLIDGVICHAGALVNGTTSTRVPLSEMGDTYTVYHIETEEHEIILANGAPAETFIDNVSRRCFDNYAEFETLYGDVPEMEELPYPRAMSARQVPPRIKAKLGGRKAA